MLKRFVVVLFAFMLIITTAAAEMPDFASMSFEELHAMKQALDLEYNSRPESEGLILGPDIYFVGQDILPGAYYASMVYPVSGNDRTTVHFYDSKEEMDADKKAWHMGAKRSLDVRIGGTPNPITLTDGEVVCVEWGSLFLKSSMYNPEDYFKYEPPAKTIVPKGKYTVGTDFPAGSYLAYPATVSSGAYKLNGEFGNRLCVYDEPQSCVIILKDGDIFEVEDALAMKKQEAFNFD